MANLTPREIQELARSIVASSPGGIRYTQLVKRILQENPETSENRVYGNVSGLNETFPSEVEKPSRGLFTPAKAATDTTPSAVTEQGSPGVARARELDFYEPFAEWLKNDLDEVTEVASLGGAGLGSRWGTPDVVGTYKKQPGNIIDFPIEIVSAEIKIDPQEPVVAFGQAIAYRLFSTKTYIAMPRTLTERDKDRLESLCMLFGVGLVLFDVDKAAPNFSIRGRAQRFSPDMFYANEFAEGLRRHNSELFTRLFR